MKVYRKRGRVALDTGHLFARVNVGDVDKVVFGRRGQQLRVVAEAERSNRPLEARKRAHTAQRFDVPQRGQSVRCAGGKVASALVELEANAIGQMGFYGVSFG